MDGTLTADLRPNGFAAASRGDFATAAAFEREHVRREAAIGENIKWLLGGGGA